MTLKVIIKPTFNVAEVLTLQETSIAKDLPLTKASMFSYDGKDYMFVPPGLGLDSNPWVYECNTVLLIQIPS